MFTSNRRWQPTRTDDKPQELKHLLSKTWSSALLDCGASKTVCGKEWLNQYVSNLPGYQQQNIKYIQSNHVYRFGDGRKITATESVTFPAKIGWEHINIQSDILDNDIPLLFSRSSVKKAEMKINFQNDSINAIREKILLITTTSSHYAIPLNICKTSHQQHQQRKSFSYHSNHQYRFKERNQKRYRKLLKMSRIPQSTTQTNSRITNRKQLPRNSRNGLKIFSRKNTTPH